MGFLPSAENTMYYLELRRTIEVGNIVEVYDKISENELSALENQTEILKKKCPIEDYVEADKYVHQILISYTQNPMLIQINDMIADLRTSLLFQLFCQPQIVKDAYIAHRRIVQALRDQDLFACIKAVNDHLDTTEAHARNLSG